MYIDFHDETNSVESDYIDLIQRLIIFAAKEEGVTPQGEVSINFVTNKEIQELNRNYRQKNIPTDVLSFPMQELGEGEEEINILDENLPVLLGDIVISVDRAKEQAKEYDHSLERELAFLALHGFLHLLGYDHIAKVDEKEMFAKQEKILGAFGIER